jgi:hypothetical protein
VVTDLSGVVTTKLPRTGRVPTRGQSTDGPIVMGLSQHDDGMEHAWSPTRSAAGRRLRPITGTEAPSCRAWLAGHRWPSMVGRLQALVTAAWCASEKVVKDSTCWVGPTDSVTPGAF